MEDKEKKKKDKNSSESDRVTLKKEIGLLSACAIIIGESLTAFVSHVVFMKSEEPQREVKGRNLCEQPASGMTSL